MGQGRKEFKKKRALLRTSAGLYLSQETIRSPIQQACGLQIALPTHLGGKRRSSSEQFMFESGSLVPELGFLIALQERRSTCREEKRVLKESLLDGLWGD